MRLANHPDEFVKLLLVRKGGWVGGAHTHAYPMPEPLPPTC